MFLRIFLFSSAFVVASANNAIPAQTYPIYQQNGYMNPQGNQPNNIQPYLQGIATQNQLQQFNISPSSIKQSLLNRLLNGQSMQAISDSNARSYSANFNGMQNNPISENVANNNYVAVARDYLNNNTSYANIGTKSNDSSTKKRKKSNKRRSKTRRQKNAEKIESSTNKNKPPILNNTTPKNIENFTENNKPSRKNIKNNNSRATKPEKDTNKSDNGNNKRTRRRKKKKQDQTTQNPTVEENKVENKKPKRRRKKQKSNVNSVSDNQVVIKSKSNEIENVALDITNEGINNENRLTRNPKKDAIELKSSPNPPKEIQNPFLSNKNQFNNPLMGNWFANFENIYQSLATQPPVSDIRPKRRRKSKRNRKPKRKMARNKNVTAESVVVKPITVGIDTTTANIVHINEKVKTNLNSTPTEESPKSFETGDLSSNEIFRDGYNINEFEGKYDPGYYGGYIDDYYPQFTDSAAYNANNKEIILKSLNDNKYYYATDTIETDFTKSIHKLNHELPERDLIAYEKNKHTYDDIEKESIRNAYIKEFDERLEQLQFRIPPLLESPDFRTRQIERSEIIPEVYYVYDNSYDKLVEDKSSNYSPAKIPYSSGAKLNGIKIQPKDVETVFAKSKVASYGPVYTPEEDSSSATTNQISWSDHSFTSDSFKNGDITYVVAKSLDYPNPHW